MKFAIKPTDLNQDGKHSLSMQFRQALQNEMTMNQIMAISPLSSTTTYRWMRCDMTPLSQNQRQQHSRRNRILSLQEELKVIQIAKEMREKHIAVTIEVTRSIIEQVTKWQVTHCSRSWISLFWQRHGWPSRRVQQRNQKELRESLQDEVTQFQNEVPNKMDSRFLISFSNNNFICE